MAAVRRSAELVVAKLHEANIPVSPTATATFNIDHAYGTAEYAAGFVERLADIGVDEVMCMIQMGTVPQDVCMETIRQWGEKIIPRLRSSARRQARCYRHGQLRSGVPTQHRGP